MIENRPPANPQKSLNQRIKERYAQMQEKKSPKLSYERPDLSYERFEKLFADARDYIDSKEGAKTQQQLLKELQEFESDYRRTADKVSVSVTEPIKELKDILTSNELETKKKSHLEQVLNTFRKEYGLSSKAKIKFYKQFMLDGINEFKARGNTAAVQVLTDLETALTNLPVQDKGVSDFAHHKKVKQYIFDKTQKAVHEYDKAKGRDPKNDLFFIEVIAIFLYAVTFGLVNIAKVKTLQTPAEALAERTGWRSFYLNKMNQLHSEGLGANLY